MSIYSYTAKPDDLIKIDDGQSTHARTAKEWMDLARAELAARTTEASPMFGQPEALLHFLKAAAQGTIDGDVSEWPQLRVACRWAVEQIEKRSPGPKDETVQRLRHQVEAAREVINRGVDIMETHQLGQWAGVRSWLEQDENDYAPFATTCSTLK